MTQMLAFMAAPFAACLVLVGIHAYFGIHVIERRVLFVDLAVAQFAALVRWWVSSRAFIRVSPAPPSTAWPLQLSRPSSLR